MRARFSRAFLLVLASAVVLRAAPDLKGLYEAHRWFDLRDALVSARDASPLYRGAVAYAFNDLRGAEKELQSVIASAPGSPDAIEAEGLLISVAQMRTDYAAALRHIRALQSVVQDKSGLDNGAAFFGALSSFPRQLVSRRGAAAVTYTVDDGNMFVPVSVNGHPARYLVDTGANFSLVSEGEARRLGLTVREGDGSHGTDASGTAVSFRVALADRLSIGGFELRNAVFLVGRDDHQPFASLPEASRGVLGIPVLTAFETMRWRADGRFEVGFKARTRSDRASNLCFDEADVHALGKWRGQPVTVFLDTGASRTRLVARFAREHPEVIGDAKTTSSTVRGVAGSTAIDAAVVPHFELVLGGGSLAVDSAEALAKDLDRRSGHFHVWAGLDLFHSARTVTIDFKSMTLSVDSGRER